MYFFDMIFFFFSIDINIWNMNKIKKISKQYLEDIILLFQIFNISIGDETLKYQDIKIRY